MAVWGFGSYYKGDVQKDYTPEFIKRNATFVGWKETEAPSVFRMLDSIKNGDIVFLKSFSPKTKKLYVKAVGIVCNTKKINDTDLGTGLFVKWKNDFTPFDVDVTPKIYRNNVFNNTVYEEYEPTIIKKIIDSIL